MPIIRKILDVGGSKGITLPKTWLEFFEREAGHKIDFVTLEVDRVVTIAPYIPKEDLTVQAKKAFRY